MCNIELYEHNQKAYDAVMGAFKTDRKVAVVQATGLGKAVVGGHVCKNFKRVFLLAPSDEIIAQDTRYASIVEAHTYAWAMNQESFEGDYDLIWLDEYHRCGGERWGEGAMRLMEAFPEAKVFGTTATDIRYLDNERNMSEELFGGNVVHRLDLAEALARRIFTLGGYVQGMYTFDGVYQNISERISRSRMTYEEKMSATKQLLDVRANWSSTQGVDGIIAKYVPQSARGVIVFCDRVDKMQSLAKDVRYWFESANFVVSKVYTCSSQDNASRANIERFTNDETEGVKIMLCVNMLNEGVHIDDVDVVMFLRSTKSKTIYLQQMGRCLTAYSNRRPVILDLVDNMRSTDYVCPLVSEYKRAVRELKEKGEVVYEDNLRIIDTSLGTIEVINKLKESFSLRYWDDDSAREEALKYKRRTDFQRNSRGAYVYAKNRGEDFYKDICSHMEVIKRTYTKDELREMALQCSSYKELMERFGESVIRVMRNNGNDFYKECISHFNMKKRKHWNEETILEEAKKHKTFSDFQSNGCGAYNKAHRLGGEFLAKVKALFPESKTYRKPWTDEEIIEDAKRYEYVGDYRNDGASSAQAADKRGREFFLMVTAHMKHRSIRKYHTLEDLLAVAKNYPTYSELRKNVRGVVEASYRMGLNDKLKEYYDKL